MDDAAEIEAWSPHGLLMSDYPPQQAHSVSCFIQFCRLAEILNQILVHLYNPRDLNLARSLQCANDEGIKMRNWWQDLPSHLKINVAELPQHSPPSHIVILK